MDIKQFLRSIRPVIETGYPIMVRGGHQPAGLAAAASVHGELKFYDFLNVVSEKYPVAFWPTNFSSDIVTNLSFDDKISFTEKDFFCDGWFQVGENSSHYFYVRKNNDDDNSFFRASIECCWDENNKYVREVYISKHPIEDITTVYLGHF